MAGQIRKVGVKVKEVPLAEVKDDLSRYLREAAKGEIMQTTISQERVVHSRC